MNNINFFRDATKMLCATCAILAQVGCAGPKLTSLDVEIARQQAEIARACYAAQTLPAYSDAQDAALIVMARALAPDPCRQTNVYDGRAQIAAAQNQAAGRIAGSIATAGIAGAGIIAGADVLKAAFHNAGNTTSTSITGNGNSAAHYDTRIANDYRVTTRGDNSAVAAASDAAGPDLHRTETTTTTVTEAAP